MKGYEDLANAIIVIATHDYINSNRGYYKQKQKYIRLIENPVELKRRSGESANTFKKRKQRYSPERCLIKMKNYEECVVSLRDFFLSQWFKELTSADGEDLLKKLDRELEKEGNLIWD